MSVSRNKATECLLKASSFCAKNSELCNVHTVDFITGKKWNLLPTDLRNELDQYNWVELKCLTDSNIPDFLNERNTPHLFSFIMAAKAHRLEAFDICTSLTTVLPSFHDVSTADEYAYFLMTLKKKHEVKSMASVISALSAHEDIKQVIDVGSGKGYLSSYLALEHGLNVLAIDSSSSNTSRAYERFKKMMKWKKRRRKNLCIISNLSMPSPTPYINLALSQNYERDDCHPIEKATPENDNFMSRSNALTFGTLICKSQRISSDFDLSHLIRDCLPLQNGENICATNRVLLCSLHACGNLSASLLRLFVSTSEVKLLCSIGCCYHHIDEAYFQSSYATKKDDECKEEYGFPLSSTLIKDKFQLGRNARMLAAQSLDRISCKDDKPSHLLYHRALLEVILKEKFPEIPAEHAVGHISIPDPEFSAYVYEALKKLKLDSTRVSKSDIEEYLVKYSKEKKRLYALQQLRIVMAQCVEGLILLDRMLFLHEQEIITDAHLVQLFDPVISPRCYGLIAWK